VVTCSPTCCRSCCPILHSLMIRWSPLEIGEEDPPAYRPATANSSLRITHVTARPRRPGVRSLFRASPSALRDRASTRPAASLRCCSSSAFTLRASGHFVLPGTRVEPSAFTPNNDGAFPILLGDRFHFMNRKCCGPDQAKITSLGDALHLQHVRKRQTGLATAKQQTGSMRIRFRE
jgi:hypothetical protein